MKKSHRPTTKVKNPEPKPGSPDWVIWAAWADRITFEEIEKKTGKTEADVIKIMRGNLKPSSFRLWRKRVNSQSIKHRKKFEYSRKQIRVKNPEPNINDPDWIIWAAWADRITFEEIEKKTGKTESEVIKIMGDL